MASMAGMAVSPFLLELNSVAAMAQQSGSSTDYRALVCIFLSGGNDGHGTVIATDPASFSAFTTARSGAPGLAYNMSDLLPITPLTAQSGRTFALNPYLSGVQNLFNAGRAAIIANTGTLVAPVTKAQIQAELGAAAGVALLALRPDGGVAGHLRNWRLCGAYRMGRRDGGASIASMNTNSAFTCISTAGVALFSRGRRHSN